MKDKQKRRLICSFCLLSGNKADAIFNKVEALESAGIFDYETSVFFRSEAISAKSPEELDHLVLMIIDTIIKL